MCSGTYGHVVLVRHVPSDALLAAKRFALDNLTTEEADLVQVIKIQYMYTPGMSERCLSVFVVVSPA